MKIHFIGIGGIGVSALAQYYLEKGHQISGSDLAYSEITEALIKKEVKVYIGQKAENVAKDIDLVVYSPAVQKDNPEMKRAKKFKIKIQSYPQALGELTKQHFTIAISGTHGKSTTTTMLGLLLIKAGLDPTIIVGTKVKELGNSNYRVGKSRYLVIEACEYEESFLNYSADITAITNIEADHLDYFKNFKNYKNTFKKFVSYLSKDGTLIVNRDDKNSFSLIKKYRGVTRAYSLEQKEAKKLKKILKVPGEHNISNALATLVTAQTLKISDKISFQSLSEYKDCWRRFELKKVVINKKQTIIVSDYGHHPTEVRVTLKAAREKWPKKEIWCVFQPHQYHRTYYLFNDFVKVFKRASTNKIIITDIYDVVGREEKAIKKGVDSEKLVKAIKRKKVIYLAKEKILNYLKDNLQGGEVVIMMGAGDIYRIVKDI